MNTKKYISIIIGLATVGSLVLAMTASAATTTTSATGQHRGGMMGGQRPGVIGTVSAISGNTITVNGKQGFNSTTTTLYTVDATNAAVTKNNAASMVSSIAVGDTISVQGTVSGTNVTATSIRDGVMMGGARGIRDYIILAHRMDKNLGQRMTKKTHDFLRGRKKSLENKLAHSRTNEIKKNNVSPAENDLAKMLRDSFYDVTQQKAFGIYNVDIAFDSLPIAVEIFGGGWHKTGAHFRRFFERSKYILDAGWHLVIIWLRGSNPKTYFKGWPLTIGARDYLLSFAQVCSTDPSFRSQYRVIRGDGKLLTGSEPCLYDEATIKRLCSADQFPLKPYPIAAG